jgi:hypothetical protein
MSDTNEGEREITLRFESLCRLCGCVLSEGKRALWSRTLGTRCPSVGNDEAECINRFYGPEDAP